MEITERSRRAFWKRPKFIFWTIVILLLGTITLQNVEPTSINILFWALPQLPKLVVILISMAIGSLLTLAAVYHVRRNRNTFTPE